MSPIPNAADPWPPYQVAEIKVGYPWPGDPSVLAHDGVVWQPDVGAFIIAVEGLTDTERASLDSRIDIAVVAYGRLVGLMVRFDGWQWQESMAGLRWPSIPPALRVDPAATPERRVRLDVIVIERRDATVQRIRTVSLSPHASRVLTREINNRWTVRLSDEEIMAEAQAWFASHPTPKDALVAAVARCKGGD